MCLPPRSSARCARMTRFSIRCSRSCCPRSTPISSGPANSFISAWSSRSTMRSTRSEKLILDRGLAGKYRSYWSVPIVAHGNMSGVIQLGFLTERSWLPRELQLLDAAVDQCLLAAEKARLMEDLAAREEQVRMLGEHMWQVEEEERRRISRELHDEAGQSMLCIRLQLEMLEKSLPPALSVVRGKLLETIDVTEKTIVEIRRIIAALS